MNEFNTGMFFMIIGTIIGVIVGSVGVIFMGRVQASCIKVSGIDMMTKIKNEMYRQVW